MPTPDPFATSDTALAAYLDYHRHKLVGLQPEKGDPKRIMYVFIKEDRTDELANEFEHGRTVVNLKYYAKSIQVMYGKLKEHLNAEK
jgi:hypothetical protein